MNNSKLYFIISLMTIAAAISAGAQETGRSRYDYDFISAANPWLTSFNAAGLGTLQVDRVAYAQAAFEKADGGLIPVEGSDDSWEAGAETKSYVKISDRIAFRGELDYSYFHGNNMGTHYFIDPSYNPVNLLERDAADTGVKIKETYHLLGGIAYSVGRNWSLGFNIEYETADYAKRKDPRTRSRWMDLDLTLGAKFSPSESFSAGLNLEYARTIEILDGDIFGTTDRQYFTLVDYGACLGYVEAFDGTNGFVNVGTSSTGYARPMVNAFYGASLQLAFGHINKTFFFNELTYLRRTGQYGNRASTQVTYTEHDGNIFGYQGTLNVHRGNSMHKVALKASWEDLKNYENAYTRTTEEGSNTLVEYLGTWQTLDRYDIKGELSYTGYLGIDGQRPAWEYGVEAGGSHRSFTATYYPYYRSQKVTAVQGLIHGKRNFAVRRNIFTVGIGIGFYTGFGTRNADGTYASVSSDNMVSGDNYLERDFEYDTLSRVPASVNLRYTMLFGDKMSAYVDVSNTYYGTFDSPAYLSSGYRNILIVTFGCCF